MAEAPNTSLPDDIAAMSFEKAMAELEQIVQALENGESDLDASIRHYERGAMLQRHCHEKLEEAKLKVEQVMVEQGKATGTKPFDES